MILTGICGAANLNLDGLNVLLTRGMIRDLITLLEAARPPQALLRNRQSIKHDPVVGTPTTSISTSKKKSKLALLLNELTVAISSVSVTYQTALVVSAEDRPDTGGLTLACTEHLAVQEITAEVLPSSLRASLQVNGLSLSHKETPQTPTPSTTGSSTTARTHTLQVLHASQFSLQAATASDMRTAQRTISGRYSFITQETAASPAAASCPAAVPASAAGARLPPFTAVLAMNGLHPVFHADAVLALCQVAADVASVQQQTRAVTAPTQPPLVSADGNGFPSQLQSERVSEPQVSNEAANPSGPPIPPKAKLTRAKALPRVHLIVQVSQCQADFLVAEDIVWGVCVPDLHCTLDSNCLTSILRQHHTGTTGPQPAQQHTQRHAPQHGQSSEEVAAVTQTDPNAAMPELSRLEQATELEAEPPQVQLKEAAITLNSKLLLFCGLLDVNLDLFPGLDNKASVVAHSKPAELPRLGET